MSESKSSNAYDIPLYVHTNHFTVDLAKASGLDSYGAHVFRTVIHVDDEKIDLEYCKKDTLRRLSSAWEKADKGEKSRSRQYTIERLSDMFTLYAKVETDVIAVDSGHEEVTLRELYEYCQAVELHLYPVNTLAHVLFPKMVERKKWDETICGVVPTHVRSVLPMHALIAEMDQELRATQAALKAKIRIFSTRSVVNKDKLIRFPLKRTEWPPEVNLDVDAVAVRAPGTDSGAEDEFVMPVLETVADLTVDYKFMEKSELGAIEGFEQVPKSATVLDWVMSRYLRSPSISQYMYRFMMNYYHLEFVVDVEPEDIQVTMSPPKTYAPNVPFARFPLHRPHAMTLLRLMSAYYHQGPGQPLRRRPDMPLDLSCSFPVQCLDETARKDLDKRRREAKGVGEDVEYEEEGKDTTDPATITLAHSVRAKLKFVDASQGRLLEVDMQDEKGMRELPLVHKLGGELDREYEALLEDSKSESKPIPTYDLYAAYNVAEVVGVMRQSLRSFCVWFSPQEVDKKQASTDPKSVWDPRLASFDKETVAERIKHPENGAVMVGTYPPLSPTFRLDFEHYVCTFAWFDQVALTAKPSKFDVYVDIHETDYLLLQKSCPDLRGRRFDVLKDMTEDSTVGMLCERLANGHEDLVFGEDDQDEVRILGNQEQLYLSDTFYSISDITPNVPFLVESDQSGRRCQYVCFECGLDVEFSVDDTNVICPECTKGVIFYKMSDPEEAEFVDAR